MKKFILITSFLAISSLFLKYPTDPDLFWHLRYGEGILKTWHFPYADTFSFTFTGYQTADSWWLSEVLIFFLVSRTGFLFPILFFSFLGAATFLAVGFWTGVSKVSLKAASAAAFLGAVVSWQIIGLRPQTISLTLFGLVMILTYQFWQTKKFRFILPLPLIFIFWANLHAGFTLGLFFIWLFWGAESGRWFWQKFIKTKEKSIIYLNRAQLTALFLAALLSSLATFINPYGFGLWQTILNDASSPAIKNLILEWLAPNFHSEMGLVFLFYLLLLAGLAYFNKTRIDPTRLLILLVFFFLALAAVRHITFFALLATPFLAEELDHLPWERLNFQYQSLLLGLFFSLTALIWNIQFLPSILKATGSVQDLASVGNYPYEAVEYLKKHPQERMFNDYGWGGYLIWQLPENKTFIDGRMPGWKKGESEILDDYSKIIKLDKETDDLLERWHVGAFLIPLDGPLAQYLKIHPAWEKVYEDKIAVIFVKRKNIASIGKRW